MKLAFNDIFAFVVANFMLYMLGYGAVAANVHDAFVVFLTLIFQFYYRKARAPEGTAK